MPETYYKYILAGNCPELASWGANVADPYPKLEQDLTLTMSWTATMTSDPSKGEPTVTLNNCTYDPQIPANDTNAPPS